MRPRTIARVSLTALLGTPVTDAQGHLRGRLKDIAVATGEDAGKVAGLVLKTNAGLRIVPSHEVMETPGRHSGAALDQGPGPAGRSEQLSLSATGPDRPPDHRHSRPQGGARQRCRSGVDGPGRGAPAARGRGRGGIARGLAPRFQGAAAACGAGNSSRANSPPAAFPGSLWM